MSRVIEHGGNVLAASTRRRLGSTARSRHGDRQSRAGCRKKGGLTKRHLDPTRSSRLPPPRNPA